jgi:Fic-DOC domain mobile mystery protein B
VVQTVAVTFQYQTGQTPLDLDEAAQLIPRHISTQGQLNEWEQANIVNALKWLKRSRARAVLSEAFCRELHKRMFGDTWKWAGTFRQSDKNIGCDWRHISTKLRQLLDNTQFWVDGKVFPAGEIALRFHHQLVLVHAFPNGNGRHARLMTDCLLNELGSAPFSWGNKANLVTGGEARADYLDALRTADAGDLEKLALFVRS